MGYCQHPAQTLVPSSKQMPDATFHIPQQLLYFVNCKFQILFMCPISVESSVKTVNLNILKFSVYPMNKFLGQEA